MKNVRTIIAQGALSLGIFVIALLSVEMMLTFLKLPRFYQVHTDPPQFKTFSGPGGSGSYANLPVSNIQFIYDGNPRGYFDPENPATRQNLQSITSRDPQQWSSFLHGDFVHFKGQ